MTAGLFTLVRMSMMLTVYPLTLAAMIALAVVGSAVYKAILERRRREALATRADWEHRALMVAPFSRPRATGHGGALLAVRFPAP